MCNDRLDSTDLSLMVDAIGYLIAQQFDFGNPSLKCVLTRCSSYNGHGFYLTKNNYIRKLPLFNACRVDLSDF